MDEDASGEAASIAKGNVVDYITGKTGKDSPKERVRQGIARAPDGEEILEEVQKDERIRVGGQWVTRSLRRKQPILDDDLPVIGAEYRKFRQKHPEPGS